MELLLPSGEQRSGQLPLWLKPGSRAVADPEVPGALPLGHPTCLAGGSRAVVRYLLENGSSTVWRYDGQEASLLTPPPQRKRFRSSLGSRFLLCGRKLPHGV